ncbi:hypothetical protein [Streptomyces longisporus]|uniref:Uncharacterized protein n=1 Tax=Streptomyces longisporus TaxID=1948 RepID=A0ABP5YWH9_STRLO
MATPLPSATREIRLVSNPEGLPLPGPRQVLVRNRYFTGTTLRHHLGLREPLTHRSAPDRRQAG